MNEPLAPTPDDKDWTVVLDDPCSDCGYDAATVRADDVAELTRSTAARIGAALHRRDAADRPAPEVWSPLEYGCHCRDVCRIFAGRVRLMLDEDDPLFANWDQDATALEQRYWAEDPTVVAVELTDAAEAMAATLERVRPDQWQRPGRRSNGSVFTVHSLARYFLHDLVHHAHDVRAD